MEIGTQNRKIRPFYEIWDLFGPNFKTPGPKVQETRNH